MATGTIKAQIQTANSYTITGGSSKNFRMVESICMIVAYRLATNVNFIDMIDYWSNTPSTIIGTRPSTITYTKNSSSNNFTITNSASTAVAFLLIGAFPI